MLCVPILRITTSFIASGWSLLRLHRHPREQRGPTLSAFLQARTLGRDSEQLGQVVSQFFQLSLESGVFLSGNLQFVLGRYQVCLQFHVGLVDLSLLVFEHSVLFYQRWVAAARQDMLELVLKKRLHGHKILIKAHHRMTN